MLYFVTFFLNSFAQHCDAQVEAYGQKVTVTGHFTSTHSYCGGVPPTQEQMRELGTPKPVAGATYYICKGPNHQGIKPVETVVTDSTGTFRTSLLPGKYIILTPEHLKPFNLNDYVGRYTQVDEACMKNWWENGIYQFGVQKNTFDKIEYNFHYSCFTGYLNCITYFGPMPPSAPPRN